MFMVTALGTAVRASRNVELQDEERGGGVGPVTSAQLAVEIRRRSIVETLSTVSQDWEYGEGKFFNRHVAVCDCESGPRGSGFHPQASWPGARTIRRGSEGARSVHRERQVLPYCRCA
jgi:hypothetical protein